MNGNGHTTIFEVRAWVESVLEGVVDLDGEIHIEKAVQVLGEELDPATVQEILRITGKEDLTEVVLMFV